MGHVERVDGAVKVGGLHAAVDGFDGPGFESIPPPSALRPHRHDQRYQVAPVLLELDGKVVAGCPRHGGITVTGAELDRSLRHGRKVHRAGWA